MSKNQTEANGSASIIGERLRELRQEHRWTLSEVAKRTGISIGTLSKLENGKTDFNFTSVNKLASGLGLRVTELTNPATSASGQRTLTRASSGTIFQTPDVDYEVLCSEISNSRQVTVAKSHPNSQRRPHHSFSTIEFRRILQRRASNASVFAPIT